MATKDRNLETYSLVWLDENCNKPKTNINTQEQLRKCINYLQTFENDKDCEEYIRSLSKDDRIILIVNNKFGEQIVPQLHGLQQISSIYVYDLNQKTEIDWIKNYPKIKNKTGVIHDLNVLIEQIQTDHSRQGSSKLEESMIFNVFNASSSTDEQSTTGLNGQFVHYQLLIDCLLRMKAVPTNRDELISLSKKQYKDNKNELAIVHEFEKDYSSDRALWWYTRESFLYRQLNKALRVQNIDSLFLFRFFIRDIQEQLEKHKCSSPIRVYRGQLMSKEELDVLKTAVGQLISMNSFVSTSIDRRSAVSFLYSSSSSEGTRKVLFEIDADPRIENIRPFANITSLSYFPGEDEVLFMLGSIFRLLSIDTDERGICILRLTLCANNDPDLQAVFDYMKNQYGTGEMTILSYGLILNKMSKYDEAERYYHRVLNETPSDHADTYACYHNLGILFDDKGDYQSSLDWHKKAIDGMLQSSARNDDSIATVYNSIAAVHSKMNNFDDALEYFQMALKIWRAALGDEHPNVGQCLSNIAGIYQMHGKCSEALECMQKVSVIYQRHLPANHPQVGDLHNNIGTTYSILGDLDLAFEHLNKSLDIKSKCLPPIHPDIAMTHTNIGLCYECKSEWQQALAHFEKAASIYRYVLPSNHPVLIKTEHFIARVTEKSLEKII